MAKILIVDDDEISREILKAVIGTIGHDILEAGDGDTCVETARKSSPDLIFLDMNMPKMTGFEVAPVLKSHPSTKTVPIVALTADSTTESIEAVYGVGCDRYMSKPIDSSKIVRILGDLLCD